MKYRSLPISAALVVALFTGCSKHESDVQAVSAIYGTYTNYADVSFRVRDLLQLGSGFGVHPDMLQTDPRPGYDKVLVIIYEARGQRQTFTAVEGDTVSATILLEAARK